MRLVAIDASTWWGGVALVESGAHPPTAVVVAEVGLRVRDSHAAHLLELMDHLLAQTAWPKSSVDAYASTRGPGSFTGLRVGLGIVRGLGLAADRPALGVGTLEAMAEAFGAAECDRIPMLDAGRGDVYAARYDPTSFPPRASVPPWVGPPERALDPAPGDAIVFGPGIEVHVERLVRSGFAGKIGAAPTSVAAGAARIALRRLLDGAGDGTDLSPLYLRPADAEIEATGRRS